MLNPLVSIIIPVYNAQKYLMDTIHCAIDQTWPNKEILIINDGSTDNSLNIAKLFESNIIKIYSQLNSGASTARNLGLKLAKGEFIQFLDADDLLSPDKIEKQVLSLLQSPNKVALCSTIHFNNTNLIDKLAPNDYEESFLKDFNRPSEFLINIWGGNNGKGSMVTSNAWLTPTSIIKKAGLWNEKLSVDDDGEFFTRVVINSAGIIISNTVKSYYRKHSQSSISLSKVLSIKGHISLYRSALYKKEILLAIDDSKQAKTAIANLFFDICLMTYKKHPRIFRLAQNSLKDLQTKPNIQIVLGGKFIQKITNLFGYKTAISLQQLKRSFLK